MRSKTTKSGINHQKQPSNQMMIQIQMSTQIPQSILTPSKKQYCVYCKTEISNYTYSYITLKQTLKNQFQNRKNVTCIDCLAKINNFKDIQEYYIVGKLDYLVYDFYWSAKEQLLLFQGLQKHGFQNWQLIANLIGSKTAQQVQDHYKKYFLSTPNFMPDNSKNIFRLDNKSLPKNASVSSKSNRKSNKLSLKKEMSNEQNKQKSVQIEGFMPKRIDFQCEYDDDAELYLAQMQFTDDDTEQQIQMKFRMIDLYNQKTQQRYKKTNFVCSRGIIDYKKQVNLDKKMTSEERDVRSMMKIFQRYLPSNKFDQLIAGLLREKQIKQKIKIYQDLSDKGITSLLQAHKAFVYIYHKNHLGRDLRHRKDKLQNLLPKKLEKDTSKIYAKALNNQQIQLCKQIKFSGEHYLIIRQTILRELKKNQRIAINEFFNIFSIESIKITRIIQFLHHEHKLILDQELVICL